MESGNKIQRLREGWKYGNVAGDATQQGVTQGNSLEVFSSLLSEIMHPKQSSEIFLQLCKNLLQRMSETDALATNASYKSLTKKHKEILQIQTRDIGTIILSITTELRDHDDLREAKRKQALIILEVMTDDHWEGGKNRMFALCLFSFNMVSGLRGNE